MRRARAAILAADRADMHDRAAARFLQQRQERLRRQERPLEIGGQDRVPVRVVDLVEVGGLVDPGIVDQDRDRRRNPSPS